MEISANFAFLKQEFPHVAESASFAERHVYADPRASCFRARLALERLVKRVYKVDKTLSPPKAEGPTKWEKTAKRERKVLIVAAKLLVMIHSRVYNIYSTNST